MQAKIVGIAIALLVVAMILPLGLNQIVDVDTSGWTGAFAPLATAWPLVAVFALIGVILLFVSYAQSKRGS